MKGNSMSNKFSLCNFHFSHQQAGRDFLFFSLQRGYCYYQNNIFLLKERRKECSSINFQLVLQQIYSYPCLHVGGEASVSILLQCTRKYFFVIPELYMHHPPRKYANTIYANLSLFCTYLQHSPPISQALENLRFCVKFNTLLVIFQSISDQGEIQNLCCKCELTFNRFSSFTGNIFPNYVLYAKIISQCTEPALCNLIAKTRWQTNKRRKIIHCPKSTRENQCLFQTDSQF